MIITEKKSHGTVAEIDLLSFIEDICNADDYYVGKLEAARGTADNVVKMFGRLITCLVENQVLSSTDVSTILGKNINIFRE